MPRGKFKEEEPAALGKTASLPGPEKIDDPGLSRRAESLLDEALEIRLRYDRDGERLDEIQSELIEIVRAYELPGVRRGRIGLLYNGERSNKYLDKGLLIENGVSPEVIAKSFKDTKMFSDARLVVLKR